MTLVDTIAVVLLDFRDMNDCTKRVLTCVTVIGFFSASIYALKFLVAIIQGFRLYVLSQLSCMNQNTREYGEWVVVTGATDGIGQSMAIEFAKRGHSIIVVGRNDEKLEHTKALLESETNVGKVETIRIDLSDSSLNNYERIIGQLNADNRDIGILVNNAGAATDKFLRYADFELDSIRCTINVNVLATAYFTRLILPGMLARHRGLILNVSSVTGELDQAYIGVYGPTKSFINAFSRILQVEYSSSPIDIINLTPGAVHTKLLANLHFRKQNILLPASDYYAKCAINAVRTKIECYSGCWVHGILRFVFKFQESIGALQYIFMIFIKLMNQRIVEKDHSKL